MERNYEIYNRELLAIIRALTEWRHYLLRSPHPVTVLSDHKNLTYFWTAQKSNQRQARWSLFLSEFELKLIHVPGTQMVQDDLFISAIDIELKDLITNSKETDTLVTDAISALQNGEALPMKSRILDWTFKEGLIFYQGKCYVPNDQDLRRKILQWYHDSIPLGHPGQLQTQEIIRRDYWWPGMHTFIKNYVEECAVGKQHKINHHPSNLAFQPVKSEDTRPFSFHHHGLHHRSVRATAEPNLIGF